MRITMINKHYPPHLGGIEFQMRDLAEALVAEGHSVRVLVANESRDRIEETINGVDVIRLPKQFGISSAPVATAMPAEIERLAEQTDVFHLHFPYPWGELSWLKAHTGLPTVVTYHSDIVRQKTGLAVYRPFMERFLDDVDFILASSPNMVEHSQFLAPRADKCRVVPFGIHVEDFASTPEIEKRAAELRALHEGHKIVLFIGRLIYYKGTDVLVRSMGALGAGNALADAHLVMIGRGPLEAQLREIAVAGGTIGRISFLPPQPLPEIVAWYHAADVFALPSVARSEAFGLVQVEAHASGTPTVSTNLTTGVPFVNQHELTGLVVEPHDVRGLAEALDKLLADDELRARYGEQAKARALADFSVPRMVEQTLGVYREAIAAHAD
ncbi:MAG TPA: glycosyltransferase [Coriobacteriia bacterium]|nr:glycosyltransferase [Coriobacteriia bacterium]